MLEKKILFWGHQRVLVCDGNCAKAWGIQQRPRHNFDPSNPDDYAYLADGEIPGDAPANPGTYEGGDGKPEAEDIARHGADVMNRWCARQCERSLLLHREEDRAMLPDFSKRVYNTLERQEAEEGKPK